MESLARCLVHSKLSISVRTCFGYIPGKCEDCSRYGSFQHDWRSKNKSDVLGGEQVWCQPECHSRIYGAVQITVTIHLDLELSMKTNEKVTATGLGVDRPSEEGAADRASEDSRCSSPPELRDAEKLGRSGGRGTGLSVLREQGLHDSSGSDPLLSQEGLMVLEVWWVGQQERGGSQECMKKYVALWAPKCMSSVLSNFYLWGKKWKGGIYEAGENR